MEISINFENKPLHFTDPHSIIKCSDPDGLPRSFQKIEDALNSGHHVAGFVSYEAGYSFEEKLKENKAYDFPLLMMGVYRRIRGRRQGIRGREKYNISDLRSNMTKEDYSANIDRIRHHISIGDVYQITYCIKHKFNFSGDPLVLYSKLYDVQPVPYSAYIDAGDFKILSLSPERFIKKTGQKILTEPMKGTWWRGNSYVSDLIERYKFSRDKKNRAENIMIADLLRNDMGRIAGHIKWPKIYTIAKYKTLFQMTSTVTGKVPEDIAVHDIFKAMFPSGSVTGAPRIRAMEIIREIEKEERRIYTGAIGYMTPERDMYFNIPIRTILLRSKGAKIRNSKLETGDWFGEMGVGGGIVWDSTAEGEWEEGIIKSKFLTGLVK